MQQQTRFKYKAEVVLRGNYNGKIPARSLGIVYGYNLTMVKIQARFSAQAAGLHKRKLNVHVTDLTGHRGRTLTVIS
jgi:hypothetical protein